MSENLADFAKTSLPQDPFLPEKPLVGPAFLDTEACLCVLRGTPDQSVNEPLWQCVGDQRSTYNTRLGKWFRPLGAGANIKGAFNDGSNPPDTSKPLQWEGNNGALIPLPNNASLSGTDGFCTGVNNTDFSQRIYESEQQLKDKKYPTSGAPCLRPGAVPIQIQTLDSWNQDGCSPGFLCPSNTVNSLPQFCPPPDVCQKGRLAGRVCTINGKNSGMGAFEPVVCQAGWYCPQSELGRKTLKCPSGSYCQPGAATPTPCSFGSHCPGGSSFETFLIPVVLLILIDVALVVCVFFTAIRNKFRGSARSHLSSLTEKRAGNGKGLSGVTARITGYKALEDETDHEMVPMNATYVPGADGWSGFQAVLDLQAASEGVAVRDRLADDDLSPQLRTFVESMRRATDATDFGLSFGYQDLACKPKGASRPILQNVTGSIQRGSLVAVMGGSGAGKSTFVNVLMGKTGHTGGAVTVNGQPSKVSRFKKLIGYVPQDDIVLPELTVYENIAHAANVRLPRTWNAREKQAHVDAVIDCLELSHVRESLVGTVSKPVISGGQRKRVSIGMELAAAPMAMFLDEPTSGLDATAANSIMRTLQALARLGISVIVIIHQPRMEIFEMLDNVILLADGQIIYEGAQDDIEMYFESAGFHFPDHSNHADVLADIVTGNGRLYKRSGDVSKASLISYWAGRASGTGGKGTEPSIKSARFSILSRDRSTGKVLRSRGAPRWKQLWLCLSRALLQQYRAKGTFASEMFLATLAGFLLGLAENSKSGVLFVGLYNKPYDVLSLSADFKSAPEMALLVAIAIGLVGAAPGVRVFAEELLFHKREAEAGHSRIAYFLAKVISPFPRMVLACLHFTVPLFLLSVPIMPWGLAFAGNLLYFYCIYGLAGCITMLIRREDAPLFATMISLIVGILSGAAPPLAKVKEWHLEWLWRASPGVWLAEMYFAHLVEPFRYLYDVDLAAEATGFHLHWLMRNNAALAAIGTAYRVLAFIGLVYADRLRR